MSRSLHTQSPPRPVHAGTPPLHPHPPPFCLSHHGIPFGSAVANQRRLTRVAASSSLDGAPAAGSSCRKFRLRACVPPTWPSRLPPSGFSTLSSPAVSPPVPFCPPPQPPVLSYLPFVVESPEMGKTQRPKKTGFCPFLSTYPCPPALHSCPTSVESIHVVCCAPGAPWMGIAARTDNAACRHAHARACIERTGRARKRCILQYYIDCLPLTITDVRVYFC